MFERKEWLKRKQLGKKEKGFHLAFQTQEETKQR